MQEKITLNDIKRSNYSEIYRYIYSRGTVSKPQLAADLRISLPTATQHLNSLMNNGLIAITGQLSSQIGRKAIAYSVVADARIAIGTEILKNVVYIVSVDLMGHVTRRERIYIDYSNDPDYREELCRRINLFIDGLNVDKSKILGIGLGMQGLVSADGMSMMHGKILAPTGTNISSFQKYFEYPCKFMHDAKCAARSELWENQGLKDAVYLSLSDHLGGAVIIDGQIQRGSTGKTGTFEHMPIGHSGRSCYCGQKDCAECYCSAGGLLGKDENIETFFRLKNEGEKKHLKRWGEYLDFLSILINNIHCLLDCQVILGGHVAPYLEQKDIDTLHKKVRKITAFDDDIPFIIIGKCRADAINLGAALPMITDFLATI